MDDHGSGRVSGEFDTRYPADVGMVVGVMVIAVIVEIVSSDQREEPRRMPNIAPRLYPLFPTVSQFLRISNPQYLQKNDLSQGVRDARVSPLGWKTDVDHCTSTWIYAD